MPKVIFAKPTYGPTPEPAIDRNHRMAIMHAANNGVQWLGDASPDRLGWSAARNYVIDQCIDVGDADGIMWLDDDLMIPVTGITQLIAYKKDFVSGLYFQRLPPHYPLAAVYNERNFNWWSEYPQNTIAPCDGIGFGFAYTSMKMIRKMKADQGAAEGGLFGGDFGKHTYGEDFLFCLRAAKSGFRPYVDTALKGEHQMSSSYATEETFKAYKASLVKGPKEI